MGGGMRRQKFQRLTLDVALPSRGRRLYVLAIG